MKNELISALEKTKIEYKLCEPMKLHTSFKIGGNADIFVLPDSGEKCVSAISFCKQFDVPYIIIGKGSNLLVNDYGYRGAVICVSTHMSQIQLVGEDKIYCEAGASLASVCNFALENALTGLEFAYGIPGNIGGAISMNAGAYGGEMQDVVCECEYADDSGRLIKLKNNQLDFSYRHSYFTGRPYCIVNSLLQLKKGETKQIRDTMNELLNRRKEKQPLEYPSAGSTFKRPEGSYASLLVDKCGLKGFRVGDAQVSEKHAGFVINRGNATCSDVLNLMEKVTKIVFEKTGFVLEPEVKLI